MGHFRTGLFILQQDNCQCTRQDMSYKTLEELSIPQLPWSAKSPDLNIIENVRTIMKRNLSKRQPHHASQEELWGAACEEWGKLRESPNLCPTIYDSGSYHMSE
ncbi:hypothetical protein HPB47_013656 [Ixodes persulcatus]|uniref:Uncharacterized protein n=1 Tax=Ixodes persulcatus TaxID=34615 RepID=A0AC60R0J2_IXOPE|nr:hypothetical protein HPB47_013656 [Ixodes persulcatus]